ncbi:MAG: 4Fe-4S cluster-binding domain-containing protein [Acetatifactor sp.]|nr:4Fe-4S cluster-binding domain-containing protein [Acetatifactor sp.]
MKIAIWGAGKFGRYVFEKLKHKDGDHVVCWIDNNVSMQKEIIEGIPVISQQEARLRLGKDLDIILVAFGASMRLFDTVCDIEENRYGFIKNRVFKASLCFNDNLLEDRNIVWNKKINKPMIYHLETNIVDYCNLNCKGCSHFSNLFNRGEKVPFETFCNDIKQISKNAYICRLRLLGGEALLEDEIVKYMEVARKCLPDANIELVTNGLLIPKQTDNFFYAVYQNDIDIAISGYKPALKMRDAIEEALNKRNIVYWFSEEVLEFGKNIDLSGSADRKLAAAHCREKKCHFFRCGKLYKCPFEVLGNKFFQHYGIDAHLEGGIDIYDESVDWKNAVESLENDPVDSCKYCGMEEKIEWAVGTPAINDWIIS